MVTGFKNPHNMFRLDRAMDVEVVERGIVLPKTADGEYPRWGLGGVCDDKNEFVDLSFYDGGWATHGGKYSWSDEEYRDETAVYFGVFFKHWGHFLVDLVGRLWLFAREDLPNVKVVYLGDEEPDGNFLMFFELLGIRREQLLRITKPTRFKMVIVPEFSCRSCVWYTREYQEIFDAMIGKVSAEGDLREVPEKVYFSRQAFGKARASEFGEDHIAQWLAVNGYTAIAPEKLSLREQIYIWNHAKSIACLDGSIPLNMAFCVNPELNLMVIHKTHLEHLNLELYLLMRPCRVVLLDAYWEPFKKYPASIGSGPFLLCISGDIQEINREQKMTMPFTANRLRIQRLRGYCWLIGNILNIRGRIRGAISRVLPRGVKTRIKKIMGR